MRIGIAAASLLLAGLTVPAEAGTAADRRLSLDETVLVVAHRACHNPIPSLGLRQAAPENSLASLKRCIALGVDIAELDVRRTRDGHLVILHDDTVDRTTNGTGRVNDLTLAQLRSLRLRQGDGGTTAELTEEQVPTLDEVLAAADGNAILNLDIKDAIYPETIAAVQKSGAADRVIVKAPAGIASAPLSAMEPYARVMFVPIGVGAACGIIDLFLVGLVEDRDRRLLAFAYLAAELLALVVGHPVRR